MASTPHGTENAPTTADHGTPPQSSAHVDDDDFELDIDDIFDDEDEDLVTYSATEAAGAFASVYRFTRPFVSKYKLLLTYIGIGLLVETAFNVIMPLSLKFLIDDALGEQDYQTLILILSILATAGIITSIVSIWYERQDSRAAAGIISDVRLRLFDHAQQLPAAYYARTKRGEVLSRFSVDMAAYESAVKYFANGMALPALELAAGIVLMFVLSWQLAVVALLILPITLIGPRILTPKAVQANYDQKVNEASILGMVQENVSAQTVVKAFGLQRRALRWFSLRNDAAKDAIGRAVFLNTMVERTVTIAVLALHLVVLAIGAFLAANEQITIGTFVTFESAFWEISYNIAHLMHFIPVLISSAAATRHMKELLDEPPTGADQPNTPTLPRISHDITFENVGFRYEGSDAQVMDGLNLRIDAGKRVAVVGPSGSGKSTLLNMILRLYEPTEGRVMIDGVDIRKVTRQSLRRSMAVVFQENILFNTSIRENIRLGKEGATDEEVEQAARSAEIHNYIMNLPKGYDTVVGERGDTLSGGQRQRIAIARAIVRDPAVLLLDEATSALDQTTEVAINRTLLRLSVGRTMIFITHRLTSVVDMDEVVVIQAGKLVERGSHQELLKLNGVYRRLWDDQLRQDHSPDEDDDDDDEDDDE